MAKSKTVLALTPAEMHAAVMSEHFADAPMPGWFDADKHSVGTGGIYETATGTLLDDEGLPQSGPARAALHDRLAAELAADAPAADAALADPQS